MKTTCLHWARLAGHAGAALILLGGLAIGLPAWSAAAAEAAAAPGEGSSVVVLYNQSMPESLELAQYYAGRRGVPSSQLFGFDLPITEEISRDAYLEKLENPLRRKLEQTGLWTFSSPPAGASEDPLGRTLGQSRIRYALVCYGVPTKILPAPGLVDKHPKELNPELRRSEASVDSQLACLPMDPSRTAWMGPWPNPAYAVTNRALLHPTNGLLLVSRLDGPSVSIAKRMLDSAIEAETNGLWGRAFLDARGTSDPGLVRGDDMIRTAERICRQWGFTTEIDTNEATWTAAKVFSDVAVYIGWYASHVSGALAADPIDFVPGAFAYHLHSFSAQTLRHHGANWAGPLLKRGASATLGYVYEPYLIFSSDMVVFLSRWLFLRMTYAEAAWASQPSLSWQTVVLGDPLYRPVTFQPAELHAKLSARQSSWLAWSHVLVVNRNEFVNTPLSQLTQYLEYQPLTRQSAVMTERLGDLYLAGKQYLDAIDTYEAALSRHPTPTQRMRLLLLLGHWRSYYGPVPKAVEWYQKFLEEFPGHPASAEVWQKLLGLARGARMEELIQQCESALKRLGATIPNSNP